MSVSPKIFLISELCFAHDLLKQVHLCEQSKTQEKAKSFDSMSLYSWNATELVTKALKTKKTDALN